MARLPNPNCKLARTIAGRFLRDPAERTRDAALGAPAASGSRPCIVVPYGTVRILIDPVLEWV